MKLPKEGADGLPKDRFYWITLKVIVQGSKGQKRVKFGYFATFWQFSLNWFDIFSLYFVYSFLGMILIYQEMGLIELFKRSLSRSKRFGLNHFPIIRHSPPGMPYGFVRIFIYLFFLFIFFILPPPRFPDDNFWPPSQLSSRILAGHGHRKKCIVFQPRATPGWGRGAPKPPNPPPKKNYLFVCDSEPQENFVLIFKTLGTFLCEKNNFS